ncbi:MAG: hypothetical protein WBN59_01530 [Flavobacteriaceae bacterium]
MKAKDLRTSPASPARLDGRPIAVDEWQFAYFRGEMCRRNFISP